MARTTIPTPDVAIADLNLGGRPVIDWYDYFKNQTAAFVVDAGSRAVFSNYSPIAGAFQIGGATGQVYSNNTSRWSYVAGGFGFATPSLLGAFSRNSVPNGHTIVQDNDELLHISAYGSDGADWSQAATISVFVDGTPGTNDMPGRIEPKTSADGTETPVRRLMIDQDGRVVVSGTTPTGRLLVGIDEHFSLGSANPNVMSANAGNRHAYVASTFDSTTPSLAFSKSTGVTVGTHGAVSNGTQLMQIAVYGSDGDEYVPAATITCFVDGTPGNQDMPGRVSVSTTADGGNTPVERLRVDSTTTAGNTTLMLWDVDNGTLERVTVGAANSGGAGFKLLRIPN